MTPTSRHHVADMKAHLKSRVALVGGCWLWKRGVDGSGYPKVRVAGTVQGAHRLAWQTWWGAVPDGHSVRTECRNQRCIKPGHLFTTPNGSIPAGHPLSRSKKAAT